MKTSYAQMSRYKYPFYIMLHPFDGFAELKYNKKGCTPLAVLFVFLWYVIEVFSRTATDFAFNQNRADRIDLRMIALLTIALFLLAVVANWCFSTFLDGKGTMKEIFTAGAYCLLPMMMTSAAATVLSWVLVSGEEAFLTYLTLFGQLWSVIMIIAAVQEIHDFNFPRTMVMICFTIVGVVLMLFLGFLVYSLAQQVVMFVFNFTYELIYRISMS